MTTKEKIKMNIDELPEDLLERVYEYIQSLRPKKPNKKQVRTFKLKGQFDKLDIRRNAYE